MRRLRHSAALAACLLLGVPAVAAQAEDPPPTTVTIVAPTGVFPATSSVTPVVQVRNGNNATVLVGVRFGNETTEHPLSCGGANVSDDDFSCELFLYYNTTLFVEVNGSVAATRTFRVRPLIETSVRSGHVVSGKYNVMRAGTSPQFMSISSPGAKGAMCLRHEVQRYRNAAWRTIVTTGCRTELDKGKVYWTWAGTHPRGVSFRIRATFPGGPYNAAGPGRWTFFRFR